MAKYKPTDYRFIRAWGKYTGSFDYYIKEQQRLAAEENAPLDAIFRKLSKDDMQLPGWETYGDLADDNPAKKNLREHL